MASLLPTHGCTQCGFKTNSLEALSKHVQSAHAPQCKVCNKTFISKEQLAKHQATHIDPAHPNECPICEQRFDNAKAMRAHLLSHAGHATNHAELHSKHVLEHTAKHVLHAAAPPPPPPPFQPVPTSFGRLSGMLAFSRGSDVPPSKKRARDDEPIWQDPAELETYDIPKAPDLSDAEWEEMMRSFAVGGASKRKQTPKRRRTPKRKQTPKRKRTPKRSRSKQSTRSQRRRQ